MQKLKISIRKLCFGKPVAQTLEIVCTVVNLLTLRSKMDIKREFDTLLEDNESINFTMDELMKTGMLVCRHLGLIAAAILADLAREEGYLPQGFAGQYRSNLFHEDRFMSAHCWAVYRDGFTGNAWICDPSANFFCNASENPELAKKTYGEVALDEMMERLNEICLLEPLAKEFKTHNKELPVILESKVGDDLELEVNVYSQLELQALIRAFHKVDIKFTAEQRGEKGLIIIEAKENPGLLCFRYPEFIQQYKKRKTELEIKKMKDFSRELDRKLVFLNQSPTR